MSERCKNVAKSAMPPYLCYRCIREEHDFAEPCTVYKDGEYWQSFQFSPFLVPVAAGIADTETPQ